MMRKLLFIISCFLILSNANAATFISVQTGDWNSSTTWGKQLVGTVTSTSGSLAVTGSGTAFNTTLVAGDILYTSAGVLIGTVSSVTDATHLTLVSAATITYVNITAYYSRASVVPGNADDIVIPAGITVTYPTGGNLISNIWKSIEVSGTLNVADSFEFNEWVTDSLIVKSGGTVNIGVDLIYSTGFNYVKVYEGGTFNVGRDVTGAFNSRYLYNYGSISIGRNYDSEVYMYNYETGSIIVGGSIKDGSNIRMFNYGYIEVALDINHNGQVNNYASGLILVHGTLSGSSSLYVYNYGVITVDGDLNLVKTHLYNYSTGMLITFGKIYIGEGSDIINTGLVQCVNFEYGTNPNSPGFNNTGGTFIVQDTVTIDGSNCPGCSDKLGTFYYGTIASNTASCGGYTSCSAFLSGGTQITLGRRLWLNASFIGYGLQTDNSRIYQWFDLANYYGFKMAQSTTAKRPYLKNNSTDNINYNPVMSFEGSNLNMNMTNSTLFAPAADGGMGIFAVVVPKATTTQSVFDFGLYPTAGYGLMYNTSSVDCYTPTGFGGAENTFSHSYSTKPVIISQTSKWAATQVLFMNGTTVASNSVTSLSKIESNEIAESNPYVLNTSGPISLGCKSVDPSSNDFEGKLAEMIVYAKDVNDATRKSTESFLALKYGITLPVSYTDYFGNTIYTLDGTYNYGIFGLARQDLNQLHQRQAHSIEPGNVLVLSTGSIVDYDQRDITTQISVDKSFIVCGHNGTSNLDGSRVYKITTTNFNQQVTIDFKYTGIASPYPSLTIDNTPTFTGSPVTLAPTSYDGRNLVFTYTFPDNATRYFKLGAVTVIPREPGVGINTTAIDTSAQLHISSATRGVLIPNVTNAQMAGISSPPAGLLVYNSEQKRYMYNVGTPAAPVWVYVGRFKTDTNAGLTASTGAYLGEIRYNTDDNKLWYWNGAKWRELQNN